MTRLRNSLEFERVCVNLSAVLMKMTGKTYIYAPPPKKKKKKKKKIMTNCQLHGRKI